jgi:hypothetical protein
MNIAYPDQGWGRLIINTGLASLLLYLTYLLVVSPVLSDREMDERRQHILSSLAVIVLTVFALTHGVQITGEYAGVDSLHSTASGFTAKHLGYSTEAYLAVSGAYAILRVAETVPGAGKVPAALADALDVMLDRLVSIARSVAFHRALLEFGHRYAMSVMFPLGLMLLLVRSFRMAGAFLAAQAVALWLVLPAVLIVLYIPLGGMLGVEVSPSTAFFNSMTGVGLLSALTKVAGYPVGPEWEGFLDWYVGEVALWLYVPVLGLLLLEGSVLLLVLAIGGGQVVFVLRRLVRFIFAFNGV